MLCLDTNIAIDFLRGDKKISLIKEKEDIFLTSITLCELFKGVSLSSKSENELKIVEEFVNSNEVLDLDKNASREFGNIFSKLHKIGKMIPESDLLIASIVKANNSVLVTRDKKHFENMGIQVEIW